MRKHKRIVKSPILDDIVSEWSKETVMKKVVQKPPIIGDYYYLPAFNSFDYECCKYCNNNPANGGSGICHCVLPYMSQSTTYDYTITNTTTIKGGYPKYETESNN